MPSQSIEGGNRLEGQTHDIMVFQLLQEQSSESVGMAKQGTFLLMGSLYFYKKEYWWRKP